MSSTQQTITFFGATGGCSAHVLALCLKAGIKSVAMVRTPEKLRKLLTGAPYSIPASILDTHLTITQGNVTDEAAVKTALMTTGRLPDRIMYGIGAAPKYQASLLHPVIMDQPTICADGMNALISALKSLQKEGAALSSAGTRPKVTIVSTTGIDKRNDVPLPLLPMYRFLLHTPHVDKKKMEAALFQAAYEKDSPISGFTVIKPTLLTNGAAKPLQEIRAGWQYPDGHRGPLEERGPEKGYLISRASVGAWIFENVMKKDEEWNGKCVSLA